MTRLTDQDLEIRNSAITLSRPQLPSDDGSAAVMWEVDKRIR